MKFEFETQHPEVLTVEDIHDIKMSDALFARKFDFDIDKKIVELILPDYENTTHS